MRILAIRGKNLASFAGEFELRLDRPPLDGAGLFAITGPTGAGKSTLLDALCLALFNRAPRFDNASRIGIGRDEGDQLAGSDGRSALRRGAADGYAETEFVGRDERRYRARWSVRRTAKGANAGRWKDEELSLHDAETNQPVGEKKTDVLRRIEELLGVTYEQFRRSALLAQGDFAAFLKANADQRAELLQAMTGMEIYTRLSRAAHERAAAERGRLRELELEQGAISVLEPEARARVEQEEAKQGGLATAAEAAGREAAAAVAWYEERARRAGAEAAAEEEARAAEAERTGFAPLAAEAAEVEAVQGLRVLVEDADRARAEAVRAAEQAAHAAQAVKDADAGKEAARGVREAAERGRTASLERRERARPDLDAAGALDASRKAAGVALEDAERAEREARRERAEAEKLVNDLKTQASSAAAAEATASAWLEEHKLLGPLAAEWPRWRQELARYEEAAREIGGLVEGRTTVESEAAAAGRAWSAAAQAEAEARRACEEAREAARRAEAAELEAGGAASGVLAERDRLLERGSVLGKLEVLLVTATDAAGGLKAEEEAGRRAAVAAGEEETRALSSERERDEAQARLAEAEQAYAQARSTVELTAHRGELRDGEPCPLCGAREHPYVAAGFPADRILAQLGERVRVLCEARDRHDRSAVAARERAAAERRRREDAAGRGQVLAENIRRARLDWAELRERLGEDAPAADPLAVGVAGRLAGLGQAAATRLAELAAVEQRATGAAEAARLARERREGLRAAFEATELAARAAERERTRTGQALATLGKALAGCEALRDRAAAALLPAFAGRDGWREALERSPEEFAAACAGEVGEWAARRTAREAAIGRLVDLGPRLASAEGRLAELRKVEDRCVGELRVRQATFRELGEQRARLFGGRGTAEVRDELERDVEAARLVFEKAAAAEAGTREAAAGARALLESAEQQASERRAARDATRAALERAVGEAGLEETVVRARLSRGEAWRRHAKATLAQVNTLCETAGAVLRDRAEKRRSHEELGRPVLGAVEAVERRAAAARDYQSAVEARATARERLRQDDAARSRLDELAPRMVEQRARVELWSRLDAVIGSADGKVFKIYAQSLTLDALLLEANGRLKDLAPRYALERVATPGALEFHVVDRDLGDEARAVSTLSGGESFLVSLALALGLSSLAARNVRVETLFIDEGFGTLDPESLETAMAALEALQATGAQVGVISHVPGLAERIGFQVRVERLGGGRSRLRVEGRAG
ncbi:MAG: AAA family ATPase [Planctomycetes bacterium]|nr:AAA family ATPase [Planctomycetota bacterium]